MPKKIVQFVGSMNLGGAESLLMGVYRNIDRSKYQFVFVENVPGKTYFTDEILKLDGEIVKTPAFSAKNTYAYYRFLVNYFKNNNIDIVHSHTYLHSWIVLAAAKKAGVQKRIAHAHSAMAKYDNGSAFKWKALKKLLLHYATDLVACPSDANVDLFNNSAKTKIIKNPVDLSRFASVRETEVASLRKKLNLSNSSLVLGHIGRMFPSKNPMFICQILKELKNNGIKFKFIWLGDGPLRKKIESFIIQNNLDGDILLCGNVSNVEKYISLFDVFIMPSVFEGLSLAAIEVQSQGVPCLFSEATSRDTKINENVSFLPTTDPRLWVNALLGDLQKIPKAAAEKNIKEQGFDIETIVQEFEKCYETE